MTFIDAIGDRQFAIDPEGRRVFFPYGVVGKGLVVPTEAEYQRLRTAIIRNFQILLPAIALLSVLRPLWILLTLSILYGIGWEMWRRRVTSGWQQCAGRRRVIGKG